MKIAIFSDIHGNYQALVSILKKIKSIGYDKIIYLGDAIALGPDSNACLKLLINSNVEFIIGNHDLYCIKGTQIDKDMKENRIRHHEWLDKKIDMNYINKLDKLKYEFELYGKKYMFCHFFLNEKNDYPYEHLDIYNYNYDKYLNSMNCDYMFYGHNHCERYDEKFNKSFIGVGSSGCTKDNNTYFYSLIITPEKTSIKKIKVKYNRKKFENRINSMNYPDKEDISHIFFGL